MPVTTPIAAVSSEPTEPQLALSLLRSALDASAEGIVIIDHSGEILVHNQRYLEIWNLPGPVAGQNIEAVIRQAQAHLRHPEDVYQSFVRITGDADSISDDVIEFADGRVFERHSQPHPLEGRPTGRVWTFLDVTQLRRAERQYKALFEGASDAVMVLDPQTDRILKVNHRACEMYGWRREDFEGLPVSTVSKNLSRPSQLRQLKERGSGLIETTNIRHTGATFPVSISATMIEIEGKPAVLATVRDESERQRHIAEMSLSLSLQRATLESTADAILAVDNAGIPLIWNSRFVKAFGIDPASNSLHGHDSSMDNMLKIVVDPGKFSRQVHNLNENPEEETVDTFALKDGRIFNRFNYPQWLDGSIVGRVMSFRDISQRRLHEEETLRSLSLQKTTLEATADAILAVDAAGRPILWNARFAELLGKDANTSAAEMQEQSLPLLLSMVSDPDAFLTRVNAMISGVEDGSGLDTFSFRDGRVFERHNQPQWLDGSTVGWVLSFRDVTQNRLDKQELADSELKLSSIINSAMDAVVSIDEDLLITLFNSAAESIFGYEASDVLGKGVAMLMPERFRAAHAAQMTAFGASGTTSLSLHGPRSSAGLRSSGEEFPIEGAISQTLVGSDRIFTIMLRDMTEIHAAEVTREKLESQLRQSQKMEAIGTLAGGIAHDFNNILYAIQGYGEMVAATLPPGSQAADDQQEVLSAALRAAELVQQILNFSRKVEVERMPVDLCVVLAQVVKLLRATLPSSIEIKQNLGVTEAKLCADPTELHQVAMNLCTNAAQAMAGKGMLEIGLRPYTAGENDAAGMVPGSYFLLTVRDTGVGMEPEQVKRIFEPFFTTKEVGQGTGLGLSIVHATVTALGGAITVYSEPGAGTAFQVYLPSVDRDAPLPEQQLPLMGQGRILFVDDEVSLARMAERVLTGLGYQVTAVSDSKEALKLFADSPQDFDIVISDETMPGLRGTELAAEVRRIRPEVPVILCTGFSDRIDPKLLLDSVDQILQKPVSKASLSRAIREQLQ